MSSIQKSNEQVFLYNSDNSDPNYDELIEYLDKSSSLITHYNNIIFDLKQEVKLQKKLKEAAQNDYFEIKKENIYLKENNNKVKEREIII